MSGNVIKKFCRETSRPSSACVDFKQQTNCAKVNNVTRISEGNDIRFFQVKRKTFVADVTKYPSCHHWGNFIVNRNELSRCDHLKILSKPKIVKYSSSLKKKRFRYCRSNFKLSQLARPNLKILRQTFEERKHRLNMIQVEKYVKLLRQPPETPKEMMEHLECERKRRKILKDKSLKVKKVSEMVRRILSVVRPCVVKHKSINLIECLKKSFNDSSVTSNLKVHPKKSFSEEQENLNEKTSKLPEPSPQSTKTSLEQSLSNLFEHLSKVVENLSKLNEKSSRTSKDNSSPDTHKIDTSSDEKETVKSVEVSYSKIKKIDLDSIKVEEISKDEIGNLRSSSESKTAKLSSSSSRDSGKIEGLESRSSLSALSSSHNSLHSLSQEKSNSNPRSDDGNQSFTSSLSLVSNGSISNGSGEQKAGDNLAKNLSREVSEEKSSEGSSIEMTSFDQNRPSSTPSRLRTSEREPSAVTLHRSRDFNSHLSSSSFLKVPEGNWSQFRFSDSDLQLPATENVENENENLERETLIPELIVIPDEEMSVVETSMSQQARSLESISATGCEDLKVDDTNIDDTKIDENPNVEEVSESHSKHQENQNSQKNSKSDVNVSDSSKFQTDSNIKIDTELDEAVALVALRKYISDDKNFDPMIEDLVHVTKSRFDQVYVVRKLKNQKEIDEFCRNPISERSKLFKNGNEKNRGPIEVQRLPLKKICGKNHQKVLKDVETSAAENLHETFTVQKVEKVTKTQLETKFPALDIEVATADANQFNVSKFPETK